MMPAEWPLTCWCCDAQAQFEAAMRQKKELADDAAQTKARMDSANALLSALAGEEGRWTAQSQAFDTTIQRLTGGLTHRGTLRQLSRGGHGAWQWVCDGSSSAPVQ